MVIVMMSGGLIAIVGGVAALIITRVSVERDAGRRSTGWSRPVVASCAVLAVGVLLFVWFLVLAMTISPSTPA